MKNQTIKGYVSYSLLLPFLGKCIYDQEELNSITQNTSYVKSLYSCTYEKKFLKEPDNQCSAVNHTEKVPGIYINETACVEFESDTQIQGIKDQLFDIPFGIRKTGRIKFSYIHSKNFKFLQMHKKSISIYCFSCPRVP